LFSSWLSISLNWVYVALLRLWCLKENRLSFAKAWYYYCYFCEKLFLPFYLLKDYVSTKLFSSNCRPLCGLIFLLIWFLSRQLTLYFRSRRWLKTLHHIFLVTTVRSFYTSPCINCCHLLLQDDGTKFIKLLRALEAYAEGSSADPIIRRATYLWNKLKSWWCWYFQQWL